MILLLDATWGELAKLIVYGFLKVEEIPAALIDPAYNELGFNLQAEIAELLGKESGDITNPEWKISDRTNL